jgi:hypothetical protein
MLAIATMAALCLTVLLLVMESGSRSRFSGIDEIRLFQRCVGGLGMGAAATPAWSLLHFDPRLQPVDDSNLWPVAGSYPFSPSAASASVTIRESPRQDLQIIRNEQ